MRPLPLRFERRQRDVEVERAVDRPERADRRRWSARRHAGRLTLGTLVVAVPSVPDVTPRAAAEAAAVRETPALRRVAERRIDAAVEAPLHAECARVVLVGLHDARFDFDLRLGAYRGVLISCVERRAGARADRVMISVFVRASTLHGAARRQHARRLQQRRDVLALARS